MDGIVIRLERPDDLETLYDLTRRAFAPMPFAGGDEQYLLNALRAGGALAISLVAEREGLIVGHAAYSPAYATDGTPGWYALGPISVEPACQHQGIGRALIAQGTAMLVERDAAGCILIGNPAYYSRFGYLPFPQYCPANEPAEFFQVLPLKDGQPRSVIAFHPLFGS